MNHYWLLAIILIMMLILGLACFELGRTTELRSANMQLLNDQYDTYDYWYKNAEQYEQVIPDILGDQPIYQTPEGIIFNSSYYYYTNMGTNSMLPLMGKGTSALAKPFEGENLEIGTIIVFNATNLVEGQHPRVSHRIINKGEDLEGVYYLTKGDNDLNQDPWKVRNENINSTVLAIIY